MSVIIREKDSGTPLAEGTLGGKVISYESNLYFEPGVVNQEVLRLTERTYTCPAKGTCNWVDYVGPDGTTVRDVAWVYPAPKIGHEEIAGRYGFYAGTRGATRQDD